MALHSSQCSYTSLISFIFVSHKTVGVFLHLHHSGASSLISYNIHTHPSQSSQIPNGLHPLTLLVHISLPHLIHIRIPYQSPVVYIFQYNRFHFIFLLISYSTSPVLCLCFSSWSFTFSLKLLLLIPQYSAGSFYWLLGIQHYFNICVQCFKSPCGGLSPCTLD